MTRNLYVGGARSLLVAAFLASRMASEVAMTQLPADAAARPYRAPFPDDPMLSRQQRRKAARQQAKVVR